MREKNPPVNTVFPLRCPGPGRYHPAMVTVRMEPKGDVVEFPRLNTVLQLLSKLGLRTNDALVIRGDELLTPDRRLHYGDTITVRLVMSRG